MKSLTTLNKYLLGGIFFGLMFPLFSQLLDCLLRGIEFSWSSIVLIHQTNVIHFVVDTAPFVLGAAGYMLGLTHQKKNASHHRLRQINESLDTLTYKITHDLKGPALNIKSLVEILTISHKNLPEEKKVEVLEKVNEAVTSWLQTFEDFMNLLRHEKSGEMEQRSCNLDSVIANLKVALEHEINDTTTTITTDFSQASTVFASEVYLNSIFKNLITNAIKYAHSERPPVIDIQSRPVDQYVEINFSDNGSGIDMETHGQQLFKLFERFNDNINIPGSGIGLYLVKDQVEKNNGSIEAESVPNEGTIFKIKLPIHPKLND